MEDKPSRQAISSFVSGGLNTTQAKAFCAAMTTHSWHFGMVPCDSTHAGLRGMSVLSDIVYTTSIW